MDPEHKRSGHEVKFEYPIRIHVDLHDMSYHDQL